MNYTHELIEVAHPLSTHKLVYNSHGSALESAGRFSVDVQLTIAQRSLRDNPP